MSRERRQRASRRRARHSDGTDRREGVGAVQTESPRAERRSAEDGLRDPRRDGFGQEQDGEAGEQQSGGMAAAGEGSVPGEGSVAGEGPRRDRQPGDVDDWLGEAEEEMAAGDGHGVATDGGALAEEAVAGEDTVGEVVEEADEEESPPSGATRGRRGGSGGFGGSGGSGGRGDGGGDLAGDSDGEPQRRAVAVREHGGHPARKPAGGRAMAFLRASWAELQRVQWPDRPEVSQATAVVLGFVIVAGIYLGVADWVAQKIINFIL